MGMVLHKGALSVTVWPPYRRFDRSAKQQRCLVPVARCAPAPGQAWRYALSG